MTVEFYFAKSGFKFQDYIVIDGAWMPLKDVTCNQAKIILMALIDNPTVRKFIKNLIRRGKSDIMEMITLCAHYYFPLLTPAPDIDDNGKLNIETNE
jgi:hypothetical protein